MVKVLIIAPQYDLPTSLSSYAVFDLLKYCQNNKVDYTALLGLGALREIFDVISNNYDLICYFGHGTETQLIGEHFIDYYLGRALLDLKNCSLLKKPKMIYTMACLSGLQLGPAIGKLGIGYFGHKDYYYAAFNNGDHAYYDEWIQYITAIPKHLIEHDKPLIALGQYREHLSGLVRDYQNNTWADRDWHITSTQSNRDFLVYFGPEDVSI